MAGEDRKVLTKEGYAKLGEELNQLKTDKLPNVLQRLKDAIGQGDISENSDYDAAMSEKDLIEVRIREIEEILENVEIIDSTSKSTGEVKYNSVVTVEDEKGRKDTYRIVGTGEVDILNGTISLDSPLGISLKGKRVGEEISVRAPRGRYKLRILEIK